MQLNKKKRLATSFIFTIGIIIILFSLIDFKDIIKSIKELTLPSLTVALIFYFLMYLFRALRFSILLKRKINFWKLFDIVCVHNLLNQLIPLRIGEISYIYMIKKSEKVNTKEGIISLLIARIYDIITIIILLIISLFFISEIPRLILKYSLILAFFLGVVFLFIFQRKKLQNVIYKILTLLKRKNCFPRILVNKTTNIKDIFRFKMSRMDHLWVILCSFFIWVFGYLFFWTIFAQIIPEISFWMVALAGGLLNFGALLLIQGVAGFGTAEGIWSVALVLLGIDKTLAISSSFVTHIIQILLFIMFGIYGIISRNIKTKEKDKININMIKNNIKK